MVVQRAKLLINQRIVRIIVLYQLLEAHASRRHILHADSQCLLAMIRLQVECYIIVHLLTSHTYVLLHQQHTVHDNLHLPFRS